MLSDRSEEDQEEQPQSLGVLVPIDISSSSSSSNNIPATTTYLRTFTNESDGPSMNLAIEAPSGKLFYPSLVRCRIKLN